jgi:hypothetical protein
LEEASQQLARLSLDVNYDAALRKCAAEAGPSKAACVAAVRAKFGR